MVVVVVVVVSGVAVSTLIMCVVLSSQYYYLLVPAGSLPRRCRRQNCGYTYMEDIMYGMPILDRY